MNREVLRRQSNRRIQERRSLDYPFNSPEWLAAIKQQYDMWPKQDRRSSERREADRRSLERRNGHLAIFSASSPNRYVISVANILDDEEKAMIAALFSDDHAD